MLHLGHHCTVCLADISETDTAFGFMAEVNKYWYICLVLVS